VCPRAAVEHSKRTLHVCWMYDTNG
jgi:hypothetical protein